MGGSADGPQAAPEPEAAAAMPGHSHRRATLLATCSPTFQGTPTVNLPQKIPSRVVSGGFLLFHLNTYSSSPLLRKYSVGLKRVKWPMLAKGARARLHQAERREAEAAATQHR